MVDYIYNNGKKRGAVMNKMSKWEYINLFVGIALLVITPVGYILGAKDPRLFIAPVIGLGFLFRFIRAYRQSKED